MRINRNKRAQKNLAFYLRHFQLGERQRYFVLVDGTFCQAALKHRVNIKEQIDKYFRCDVTLCTTACAVLETQKLTILHGALQILKHYKVEKCAHSKPVAASQCLLEKVRDGNPGNYFVATQDSELAAEVHKLVGVPRLKLYNAITLEDPSEASTQHVQKISRAATDLTGEQRKTIALLKKKMNIEETGPKVKRLKKKLKGPNPLSCLPKKKKGIHGKNEEPASTQLSRAARRKARLKKLKNILEVPGNST
ncbi:rRNA-processing protein UTP23 homolog [Galendromus occidentalis]|uniref:rRNA-processing protein UTP23 homolog n=1 Tax=Galendromus occidentalis TaxID=34638 RepID=A0AAJ6VZ56_9ACAR|nr:rRNA-processing protein UTP23 homolog [Galendromus occidentalis]